MPFEASDRALVDRAKDGDVDAFGALHDRYYGRIYRLAYLKTGNAEEAQDVASETFCRALQHLPRYQFRRTESLYPWLHRIATNLMVDAARARPAGGLISLDAELGEDLGSFPEQLPDPGAPAQEVVERKEIQEVVREAIRRLPADQCDAVCYRFLADMSIKEIARALDRSEGAVKSLLHRALVSLRRDLLERLLEMGAGSQGGARTTAGAPRRATATSEAEMQNVIRIQSTER